MQGLNMLAECDGSVGSIRRNTLTENLKMRKESLERDLNDVKSALAALEKNPELQNLFDIVSRVR
jgi:hypothetical protein